MAKEPLTPHTVVQYWQYTNQTHTAACSGASDNEGLVFKNILYLCFFCFSSRRRHTSSTRDWSSDVCSSDLDRWVWYAGWADKIAQVYGNANPVAGPFFNVSTLEPVGVVGIVAPQASSLLGLVSVLAPVIVTGNTAVVLAAQDRPLPA